ncbi:MAG: DnaJ domain-containing protein [Brumimicrobium sp.]|nr:DnaJ domain-containing protein [Brumimicrobium sp.]
MGFDDEYTGFEWAMFFIIGLPFILLILYTVFRVFRLLILEYFFGIKPFSEAFKPTPENVKYAFLVLGWHMSISEIDEMNHQTKYLFRYLQRLYPATPRIEYDSVLRLHTYHPDPVLVLKWFERALPEEKHIEVVDFLVDLAFYNDYLHPKEKSLIYMAGRILKIPEGEMRSLFEIRYQRQRERQQQRSSALNAVSQASKKETALKILGITEENPDFATVKKVYRNLAKKHHPDVYVGASNAEKKLAGERFASINKAYEYLEEILK